jgi:uncharacterized membrane protein
MTSLWKAAAPEVLGADIRSSTSAFVGNRRLVVALDLLAAGCMSVIALYQIGLTRHVPEPDLPLLNADKVDASAEAYEKLSVGDAFLGFASYGVTMLLAAMGGTRRHETHPYMPLALAAKASVDAAQAAKLTVDQWRVHRAFCSWCLTAAVATFAVVPLVVPEARAALKQLQVRR